MIKKKSISRSFKLFALLLLGEKKINNILAKINLGVIRTMPRHSTRFAIKHFGMKEIEVVEIGTYKGFNARNLIKSLNISKLFIIDPYIDYGEEGKDDKDLHDAEDKAHFILRNHTNKIRWIKKLSDESIELIPKVDFVYIDGEHTYKQTKKDMQNYWNKVKKGGIMGGHDITNPRDSYGIARAFVEFCSENKLRPYISRTDWWVVKENKDE